MKKRSWLYIIGIILLFFVSHGRIFANEKPLEVILTGESYDAVEQDKINRFYRLPDGSNYYMTIDIPEEIQKTVAASKEPLLEAKKQLTALYLVEKDEERLSELNNEYHQMFAEGTIYKIDESYEKTFKEQKKEAKNYADKFVNDRDLRKEIPKVNFPPYRIEEVQKETNSENQGVQINDLSLVISIPVIIILIVFWSMWPKRRLKNQLIPDPIAHINSANNKGGEQL